MFAVITTDEYKELLDDQQVKADYQNWFNQAEKELEIRTKALNDLLLMLTKGEKASRWEDRKFESCDLASSQDIADYLNSHFVKDGILQLKENKQ